ncbi:hypothetical protein KC327_g5087 [Hortaea werneckii]|uniref:Zn(2)-C6 fungal-type domain-containing protein n=1 Tax=Hortaea werneckii EXF-2000 TaxID=1157616 RepID=A0A1Z5TCH7_HORWE|nr:hypothetical protein KC321_g9305 [Hortaea werneckii]OTA33688.1 hypothetical protein BTJ68_04724 [Hortaea werneckii EXF-2000]KAI7031639.1 hypothetical protein KC366_g9741 [Hortaea werneckii]KAI7074568.1 hypothetical protein KC327_g5087 [Hortaea werneckii]KAI7407180.1 hypothetical protein KC336_g13411 [Hortaea werneckii]
MLPHFNHIQFPSQPTPPSLYPPNTGPTLPIPSQSNPKLRAACDECRLKKLKCTGEQPACSRCVREGIQCIYSPQKQMGRPKKRQRVGAAEEEGEAFYPQQQQEEHLAPLPPTSKPSQMGEKDSDLPPFTLDFSQANQNTAAAADATMTSDWTTWEDFEKFLGNGDDNLPSWFSSNNWSAEIPGQDALPGLTPDFANNFPSEGISPPIVNVPPELLLPRQTGVGKDASRENDFLSDGRPIPAPGGKGEWGDDGNLVSTLLPPITTPTAFPLTPPPPPPNPQDLHHHHQHQPSLLPPPSCACLSTLYLTLSTLQPHQSPSSPSSPSFPHTLVPLRKAMQTATSILTCPICPQKFLSAMQNTQLLGTLLVWGKKEEEGPSLRSSSTSTSSTSPSPFAATTTTTTANPPPPPIHFLALTKAMYDRQLAWHSSTKEIVDARGEVKTIPSLPEDFPRDRKGRPIGGPSLRKEDHMCLKFRGFAEKLVDGLDWS